MCNSGSHVSNQGGEGGGGGVVTFRVNARPQVQTNGRGRSMIFRSLIFSTPDQRLLWRGPRYRETSSRSDWHTMANFMYQEAGLGERGVRTMWAQEGIVEICGGGAPSVT